MDISDVISDAGYDKVKVGQILTFQKDKERIDLKITKKAKGKIYAKRVITFDPEDINVTSRGMFGRLKHKKVKDYTGGYESTVASNQLRK